jgi:tRNA-specific 2-thiouridylase
LFPLGGYEKNEVRELAKNFTLPNADRKDSQGLCFIGNVPIREFLLQRFDKKEGDIVYLNSFDATEGKKVGTHQGAYFYTIGQKHGLGLNFKAYVYRIDIEHNILYVTDKDNEELKSKTLIARDWHWILSPSSSFIKGV